MERRFGAEARGARRWSVVACNVDDDKSRWRMHFDGRAHGNGVIWHMATSIEGLQRILRIYALNMVKGTMAVLHAVVLRRLSDAPNRHWMGLGDALCRHRTAR
jgi:hypothetical protein